MLERSQNKKAQAQAEDILPTHDQEDREAEEEKADYVRVAMLIIEIIRNVNNNMKATQNVRAFQKVRANPRLANASKHLLTTGKVSSQSTAQAQKAFAGTTLAMTKNARMLGVTMAAFSLGHDLAALSKEWKHLKEGARTRFAEELSAKASELERNLTELTELYQSLQQKVRSRARGVGKALMGTCETKAYWKGLRERVWICACLCVCVCVSVMFT
nr:apolipoprotein L6 [Aotus nancymaae]